MSASESRRPKPHEIPYGRSTRTPMTWRSTRLVQDPPRDVMVTSAEDIILRKMLWYREGNEVSDRQWSDILGVLKAQGERLDQDYPPFQRARRRLDRTRRSP
jgi:hypothetical protein